MPTKIAWTDESWNPVTGCTPVSEGCAHCYAERDSKRWGRSFDVTMHPDRLEIPLHWQKPRMVFTPSMGDLFHEDVPGEFIADVFAAMIVTHQHQYQVLTKRPARMKELLEHEPFLYAVDSRTKQFGVNMRMQAGDVAASLPNVWLGVSVENQARADERIPLLLETPAAVRFVSAEPLLGPLDLAGKGRLTNRRFLPAGPCRCGDAYKRSCECGHHHSCHFAGAHAWLRWGLDWVIVGGESGGPPERRLVERCDHSKINDLTPDQMMCVPIKCMGWRPKHEAIRWVRSLRDQCAAAGVPFFFKQWGPRAGQGTLLDRREWREMPRQEVRT